jgi:hypothetical protein
MAFIYSDNTRLLRPTYSTLACLGHTTKVAKEVIRGLKNKQEEYRQSICGQRQANGLLKRPSANIVIQLEQKPAMNNDKTVNRTLSLKRTAI